MKKTIAAVALASSILVPTSAQAMSHSISTDIVRQIDKNMYDGMFNLYWQGSLSKSTAVRAGYSTGTDMSIIDVTYKKYIDRYHQGVFVEGGGSYWDGKNDSSVGILGAVGYERTLASHFVAGGSVQMYMGIDEKVAGAESPFFTPSLFVLFAF